MAKKHKKEPYAKALRFIRYLVDMGGYSAECIHGQIVGRFHADTPRSKWTLPKVKAIVEEIEA